MPLTTRMFKPLFDRPFAPAQILRPRFPGAGITEPFGNLQKPFGCAFARFCGAVQHHILASLTQFSVDRVIDRKPGPH